MNARMVQGIFDDLNPDAISRWIDQSIPADWSIRSPRKAGVFRQFAEITGPTPTKIP